MRKSDCNVKNLNNKTLEHRAIKKMAKIKKIPKKKNYANIY